MLLKYRVATLLILAFLPLGGFAASKDMPIPPPLGRLVDIGGYRLHLYCTGEGGPKVVVTGTEFSFDWALVQLEVAKFVRICTYDASGIAWSDPGPTVTCQARVAEIHNVLRNGRIEPPYVLVGFSMGAVVARLYANRYPTETAGMVFVDHAFLDVGPLNNDPPLDGAAPSSILMSRHPTSGKTASIPSVDEPPPRDD